MKRFITQLSAACITFLSALLATAAPVLTIDAPDRVSAAHNFQVAIHISGLDAGVDLGAFSFDFSFLPGGVAAYSASTTNFGNQLGDDQETIRSVTTNSNTNLSIFQVSLLPDLGWQADEFLLVDIGLYAVGFHSTVNRSLSVAAYNFLLSDALGDRIYSDNCPPGSATTCGIGKSIIVVPEPATGLLAICALLIASLIPGIPTGNHPRV